MIRKYQRAARRNAVKRLDRLHALRWRRHQVIRANLGIL